MLQRRQKLVIVSILFIALWNSSVFANTDCLTGDTVQGINFLLDLIVKFLARLWMPLAMMAGKLMSNSMVYGEFLNLDKSLYLLRNISRTFANFVWAGIILRTLIEGMISGEGISFSSAGKTVMQIIGGIILANTSRFLIGAVVDISNIATMTVGAMPAVYFSNDTASRNTILTSVGSTAGMNKMTLDLTAGICDGKKIASVDKILYSNDENNNGLSDEEILDTLMPKNDSIAWPLLYIWSSVLRIQDFVSSESIDKGNLSTDLLVIIMRLAVIVMFVLVLIILIVINIMRIVYLWFFIAFAPLLLLAYIVQKDKTNKTISNFLPNFSLDNIIKIVFAPVIITGLMGIAMIVVVLMQQVLQTKWNTTIDFHDGIHVTSDSKTSSIMIDGIMETSIQGDLLRGAWDTLWNFFSDLILLAITLAILRGIVKIISVYNKWGIWEEAIKSITKLWGDLVSNIPIIPMGNGQRVGIGSALKHTLWDEGILKKMRRWLDSKELDKQQALDNEIKNLMGIPIELPRSKYKDLTKRTQTTNSSKLSLSTNNLRDFITHLAPIKNHYKDHPHKNTLKFSDMSEYREPFEILLKKLSSSNGNLNTARWIKSWTKFDERKTDDTISTYIARNYTTDSNKEAIKYLYKSIGGNASTLRSDNVGKLFWDNTFNRWE